MVATHKGLAPILSLNLYEGRCGGLRFGHQRLALRLILGYRRSDVGVLPSSSLLLQLFVSMKQRSELGIASHHSAVQPLHLCLHSYCPVVGSRHLLHLLIRMLQARRGVGFAPSLFAIGQLPCKAGWRLATPKQHQIKNFTHPTNTPHERRGWSNDFVLGPEPSLVPVP